MLEWLIELDKSIFLALNAIHNETWDKIMVFTTGKKSWYPMYGMIITFLFVKFRRERWFIFVAIAILITLTDQIASGFFKPTVGRLRPCHDPSIQAFTHILTGCGGKYGFFSSHAANTFGISTLIYLLTKDRFKWLGIFMIVWAIVVSYSRIYVGVHYPLDIISGAICGILVGNGVFKLYQMSIDRFLKKVDKGMEKKRAKEPTI